jgi:molybdopterin-guanine dinucleotide biosynthesis protein B
MVRAIAGGRARGGATHAMGRAAMTSLNANRATPVVGFVGPSGVGKTSLVECLVAELRRRGHSVGAVKHASHGFLADRPGKDSYRFYESGADAVALISREQIATFTRAERGVGEEVSLADTLATLPADLDLVLAEGFSWEPIPRVVLVREDEEPAPAHVENGEVLEVVNAPSPRFDEKPEFPAALIEALSQILEVRIRRGAAARYDGAGRRAAVHDSAA